MDENGKKTEFTYNEKSKMKKDINHCQDELPHSGELSANRPPNEYDLANMERKGRS